MGTIPILSNVYNTNFAMCIIPILPCEYVRPILPCAYVIQILLTLAVCLAFLIKETLYEMHTYGCPVQVKLNCCGPQTCSYP